MQTHPTTGPALLNSKQLEAGEGVGRASTLEALRRTRSSLAPPVCPGVRCPVARPAGDSVTFGTLSQLSTAHTA